MHLDLVRAYSEEDVTCVLTLCEPVEVETVTRYQPCCASQLTESKTSHSIKYSCASLLRAYAFITGTKRCSVPSHY